MGLTGYWKISDRNVLKDYQQLVEIYNLEKQDFFRYLQLRHHYDRNIKFVGEEDLGLVNILLGSCKGNAPKKQISRLYSCLQVGRNLHTTYIKARWEKEGKILITDEDWLNICNAVTVTSSSGLWREFSWKNMVRFFITPSIKRKQCKDPDRCSVNYSVSSAQASNLEYATRNQSFSPLWYQHRTGRFTASKAHDVLVRQPITNPDSLIKRIVGYKVYDLSKSAAVKWGTEREDECRQAYSLHQKERHIIFTCRLSGFVIDPNHPFLGASPDGAVNCDCCGNEILEVKCPFKHRNDFCLDATLHLKENHRYYTQVQIQMFLTKSQYCDFVVFTKSEPASISALTVCLWGVV
uniref:YqaJ viral recombinase domain-containing protein n=1 Tax=Fundulus heteroclitus TaxID=8078 RepID=A0A3Q2NZ35_FUNHE